MTFEDPGLLVGLLLVPVAIAVYVLVQRRRSRYAVRFTNVDLLANVAPRSPGWRRHVPPALYLLAMAALLVGLARPTVTLPVARDEATVMLAIDTSGSMSAQDVAPSRLEAAQRAASAFVDELPSQLRVGVVAFSSDVRVVVAPTTDRKVVHSGLDSLVADGGTAIGDAIEASLGAAGLAAGPQTRTMVQPLPGSSAPAPSAGGRPSAPPQGDAGWPSAVAGRTPTTATVLLSDGESTVGTPPLTAADAAASAGMPVYTIALGTADGSVDLPDENGRIVRVSVPPDTQTLSSIARRTGGRFFDAPTSADLSAVYHSLGSRIGYTDELQEVTRVFAAAGLVLVALGAGLAALWFNRFP